MAIKNIDDRLLSTFLFTFDSLVDLDLAFMRFFKKNFSESKYIDNDIIKNNELEFYKALLVERDNKNPLSIIVKPKYYDQIDSLYSEVYNEHQQEILDFAGLYSSAKLIKQYAITEFMTSTILCKNELEEQYCKQHFSSCITLLENSEMDVNKYDAFYFKDIDDLKYLEKKAKDVFVLNFKFNLERGQIGVPKLKIYGKMLTSMHLHFLDPYIDYKKPI